MLTVTDCVNVRAHKQRTINIQIILSELLIMLLIRLLV